MSPYIKQEQRNLLAVGNPPKNCGELNYKITTLILKYLPTEPHYSDYNEIMGVLSCIQHELYRKMVVPYEGVKEKENGKVY